MNTKNILCLFVSFLFPFAIVSCSENAIVPDTIPPRVSISQPTSGIVVSYEVPISVYAEDNEGISKVQIFIDGNLIAEDADEPYDQIWYSGYWAGGEEYQINAVAHDMNGNQKKSSPIIVRIEEGAKYKPTLITPIDTQSISSYLVDYSWEPVPGARGYTLKISIPGYELDYSYCNDGTEDVCFVWVDETTYTKRLPFNRCCYWGIPIDVYVSVRAYWTSYLQSEWSEEHHLVYYLEPQD